METGDGRSEQEATQLVAKDPLAVFDQMEQAREAGNVPNFLHQLQTLDQIILPASGEFPAGIRATEIPGIRDHLRLLGKTPDIWTGAYDSLEKAVREDNPAAVLESIRLVELLGIPDEAPKVGDYILKLREKYTATLSEQTPFIPLETSTTLRAGVAETIGKRPTMEDAHRVVENFGGRPDQSCYAIYDGHRGREVADFAATGLHELLLSQLTSGVEPKEALRQAYLAANQEIEQRGIHGGATAITAFIQNNKLFVANVGDARAVLSQDGNALQLSHDHKATDPQEIKQIKEAGGFVIGAYVQGGLAVTRALGDSDIFLGLKNYSSAEPHLSETTLRAGDNFLILACDGVWDVLSNQEAVDLIKSEPDPQKAAEILKNKALEKGSADNISVIIVNLQEQLVAADLLPSPFPDQIPPAAGTTPTSGVAEIVTPAGTEHVIPETGSTPNDLILSADERTLLRRLMPTEGISTMDRMDAFVRTHEEEVIWRSLVDRGFLKLEGSELVVSPTGNAALYLIDHPPGQTPALRKAEEIPVKPGDHVNIVFGEEKIIYTPSDQDAERYWQSLLPENRDQQKKLIRTSIEMGAKQGILGVPVQDSSGFQEADKESMAAFCQQARELGYEIVGDFVINYWTKRVEAPIRKIETETPPETTLTPERQALEQAAAQQAEALAKQTGSPLTEEFWAKYEQWRKLQKE